MVRDTIVFILGYAYSRWLNSATSGQMTKHGNRVPISLSKSELRKLCTNKTVTIQISGNTSDSTVNIGREYLLMAYANRLTLVQT